MQISGLAAPLILTLLAGLSTVLGSFILFWGPFSHKKSLGFFLGLSAGVMIYLSFIEMLPFAIDKLGYVSANVVFFSGIFFMGLVDSFFPHHFFRQRMCRRHKIVDHQLLSTGMVVTFGLIIHNMPEGAAVFLSSLSNLRLGIFLALAIAIHNIPEGIAVATPIYHATLSKSKAFWYAFISGMAEPLGGLVAYVLLKPYLNTNILAYIFALVAGVMIYISLDELLPACFRQKQGRSTILGIVSGMFIVSLSLVYL